VTIAVTGATGHLGRLTLEHLLRRGVAAEEVVAVGRSAERLASLDGLGVRTAVADYDDAPSLEAAITGVDTLVLVSGSEVGKRVPQHTNAIRAAERAGVTHVVYTSAPHADVSRLAVAPEHRATEDLLAGSPMTTTVLRNNWYNENYEQAFAQAAATRTYLASTGSGAVASAARSDFAEAAAVVAATGARSGDVLELAGDTAWDGAAFAATAGRVLGRDITFAAVSTDEHRAALAAAGLDEGVVEFLVTMDADIAAGALDGPSSVLSDLIGHPTTTLEQTFRTFSA
jgi:NAD(P)H dehydrogenase (quinone)